MRNGMIALITGNAGIVENACDLVRKFARYIHRSRLFESQMMSGASRPNFLIYTPGIQRMA
jgi:hypothetical protein